MAEYYRFIVGDKGIYEAVDKDCPKSDERRKQKPDGSWLAKVGMNYPGAISFWTKKGLQKYISSGLLKWHTSVIKGKAEVIIINEPKKVLYKDENQMIIDSSEIHIKTKQALNEFIKNHKTI